MTQYNAPTHIKRPWCLFSLVLTLVLRSSVNAQDPPPIVKPVGLVVDGYTLSIAAPKSAYSAGDPVMIHVTLRNVGETEVIYSLRSHIENFQLEVILPNGEISPLTLYGKKEQKIHFLTPTTATWLKPTETAETDFHINRLYDMSLPGLYRIKSTTKRNSRAKIKSTVDVVSNILEIKILDITTN